MAEGPETQPSTSFSDQSSSQHQTQAPALGSSKSPNVDTPMYPIMYPGLVPGFFPPQLDQEQMNRGPGLYAVPVLPCMQPYAGLPPNALIPFTYNVPTERSAPEMREGGGEQGQPGEQLQQQGGPQRHVVRRFQIAIQLDLLLILKLAAVIFLFNQDGTKQRLTILVFFASLVYLYQTGALAPVIRWLSQGMQRAAAPPRANNLPAAAGAQGNENVGVPEGQGVGGDENEHHQVNDGNDENAAAGEAEVGNNRWWGIVKEIQMIVFGFITSLLPGFHNID